MILATLVTLVFFAPITATVAANVATLRTFA